MQVRHHLRSKVLFVGNTSVFLSFSVCLWEKNLKKSAEVHFWASRAKHYLWRSDWLKLLGWLDNSVYNIRSVPLYCSKLYLHLTSIFVHSLVTLIVWKLIGRMKQLKRKRKKELIDIFSWLITQRALYAKTDGFISAWNSFSDSLNTLCVSPLVMAALTVSFRIPCQHFDTPAADVGLFLKLRLIRYCAVFIIASDPLFYLSLCMAYWWWYAQRKTKQSESVAVTHIPLEWDRVYLCLWNTLGWVQMHFSGSADDPKGPVMNRKAKSQHYMLSIKSDGYEKEYRHWLDQL